MVSAPTLEYERQLYNSDVHRICGVDEAGRGPLAGPVVAVAVILPDLKAPWGGLPEQIGSRLNDSKCLRPTLREELAEKLPSYVQTGIGWASVEEIDTFNILQATFMAMTRAVQALPTLPQAALIDGNQIPPLSCPAYPLIKGDTLSLSIAAASIIAKVTRDRYMSRLAQEHPQYGWDTNQGYGTATHLEGLRTFGPTPHHRRSFTPVKEKLHLTRPRLELPHTITGEKSGINLQDKS